MKSPPIHYIISLDDIKNLDKTKGYVIDYIIHMAAQSYYDGSDEELICGVVEDSLRLFPKILEVRDKENLSVYSYTSQIINSSIAKHWSKSVRDTP